MPKRTRARLKLADDEGNANHLYIGRHELKLLRDILQDIPHLSYNLWIAETKQARLSERGGAKPKGAEQPLIYDPIASEAADALHAVLVSWAKLVCEQRAMEYVPIKFKNQPVPDGYVESTPGLAKWLDRYLISLAMTEGAEVAYPQIKGAYEDATWVVCPPLEKVFINHARHERARKEKLNAAAIGLLAKELGEEYRNLTARRVRALRDAKVVRPAVVLTKSWTTDWPTVYIVGQVLDAHLAHPIRRRHVEREAAAISTGPTVDEYERLLEALKYPDRPRMEGSTA